MVQWRELAYCITQLQISDKGLKTLAEQLRLYKHTLTDSTVFETFHGIAAKGKKSSKAELKDVMVEWERQLVDAAGACVNVFARVCARHRAGVGGWCEVRGHKTMKGCQRHG